MTRYFLKSITIEGFRGINNSADPLVLKFKPDAVNSVHAPNGVGKSSIYEAIHFAIHDSVPRLQELQGAEQGNTYIVNKFHPGQTATVEIVFSTDDGSADVSIRVTRPASGSRTVTSPSGHTDPHKFLAMLQEDFVLVDYGRFARFIDNTPLIRGRSFATLVGLSRYSHLRQALEGAKDTRSINTDFGLSVLETEVDGENRALAGLAQRALTGFTEVTGQAASDLSDPEELKAKVTEALKGVALLHTVIAASSVMDMDFDLAEKAIEQEEGGQARTQLAKLGTATTNLKAVATGPADVQDIEQLIELGTRRNEAVKRIGSAEVLSLLKAASEVVSGPDWTDPFLCPVCDQKGPKPLKERLDTQIELYAEVAALDEELCQAVAGSTGLAKLGALEDCKELAVAAADRLHANINSAASEGAVALKDLERAKARLEELETKRAAELADAIMSTAEIEAKLPPSLVQVTKLLSSAKQFRDALKDHDAALVPLNAKRKKLERLKRWKKFIGDAADLFCEAETALADERIKDIQAAYQGLFTKLVRGGPDMKPTLARSKTSENVDLRLEDFFGLHGVSARALLSESYRNAVAAAIFLSAATKQVGAPRFMVLDDITSSFDAGHQFALMEAMRTELRYGANPDGVQFIVLSHDTTLEKYFDRLNGTADWHHQKLQGMPPVGRVMASAQEADRLKIQAQTYLNAGQVDVGSPFVRQYLEYKLGQIITRLAILVPPDYASRGDKRTLSTYLDAIVDAVTLYEQAGRCVLESQQVTDLKSRHAPSIVSNFVSHYETNAGTPFNAYALLGVLTSVDDLADCFMFVDPPGTPKKYYRRLDRKT